MNFSDIYRGKRVLVTGHTGFKGSWLCEWLLTLGADVHGLALVPDTEPSLFVQLALGERVHHRIGDIRNLQTLEKTLASSAPDIVFHLAAQPLVRRSYQEPLATFETNVMGTANLLEAIRLAGRPCAVVVVTSDKCYENLETEHAYRETDALGGYDCYSASKAAAEIVASAYRRSFFRSGEGRIRLATARAGNVIGGGDWAADRIVPDCIRHLQRGEAVPVRNPRATRPWQHVLEPLGGYLLLGTRLMAGETFGDSGHAHSSEAAFNFGPGPGTDRPVGDLVEEVLKHWPGSWEDCSAGEAPHEAQRLDLAIHKSQELLGWRPRWDFTRTVAETASWYRAAQSLTAPEDFQMITRRQIGEYSRQ